VVIGPIICEVAFEYCIAYIMFMKYIQLMIFKNIIVIYSENQLHLANTFFGRNAENPKPGGIYLGRPESKDLLGIALAQVNELHHFKVNGPQ
jgi:hypothetical protein